MHADLPPVAITLAVCSPAAQEAVAEGAAARQRGDWRKAAELLEPVVRDNPRDADAWLQLGFAYAAGGDEAAARAAFERTLELAPDYDDAKLGLAQLAYRSGDLATARLWIGRIGSERWSDPEVAELRERLAKAAEPDGDTRFGVFSAHSTLTEGLPDWREVGAWASLREGRRSVGASIEAAERFERTDVYAELRYAEAGRRALWSAAAGVTPDADFRPRAALRLEVSTLEDAPWLLSGAVTLARYNVGQVNKADVRAGRTFGPLRLTALGVVVNDENGETHTGYGVGAMWRLYDRLSLSASWSDAPETADGVTRDVRSTALSLAVEINEDIRFSLGALHEDRDAYDRDELSVSLTRTF